MWVGATKKLSLSHVVLPHHHGSVSSRLSHLHWLPVHRRIQCKTALITYKTLTVATTYLELRSLPSWEKATHQWEVCSNTTQKAVELLGLWTNRTLVVWNLACPAVYQHWEQRRLDVDKASSAVYCNWLRDSLSMMKQMKHARSANILYKSAWVTFKTFMTHHWPVG